MNLFVCLLTTRGQCARSSPRRGIACGVLPPGSSAPPFDRLLLLCTKPKSASCRQAGAEPAPGGGRNEASAVLSHPPTTGWVGGGLGGARSSLATPRPPKPQKVKKPCPQNPLEFVRWMFHIGVRGRYASYSGIYCAVGVWRVPKSDFWSASKTAEATGSEMRCAGWPGVVPLFRSRVLREGSTLSLLGSVHRGSRCWAS